MSIDNISRYKKIKPALDEISPSMCLAKWLQVTMHLHNGQTHSCHHPRPHHIPLEELKENPSALHNTKYKKQRRKEMLDGIRCAECQYCWNVEDLTSNNSDFYISDRYIKSSEKWSRNQIHAIKNMPWDSDINPSYVEVSFSNLCNFKCSYCSPIYSTQWVGEIKKHGAYPTSEKYNNLEYLEQNGDFSYGKNEYNPYVEAFWKYWPTMIKDLKVLRITGGEPLIDPNTFKILEYLIDNPKKDLEISVNSNLCPPDDNFNEFIKTMKIIASDKPPGLVRLYTSVDTAGKQAEFIRTGLNYNKWLENLDIALEQIPSLKATIMCTTNILSLVNFDQLLKDILQLKIKHYHKTRHSPLTLDMSILRYPKFLNASILPHEYGEKFMNESLLFMKSNEVGIDKENKWVGFYDFEILRMERFIEFIKAGPNKNEGISIKTARSDFYSFINEYEIRRSNQFLDTFPQLEEFYLLCKREYESINKLKIKLL